MDINIKLKIIVASFVLASSLCVGTFSASESWTDSYQISPTNKCIAGFFPDDGVPKYKPKKKNTPTQKKPTPGQGVKYTKVPAPPSSPERYEMAPVDDDKNVKVLGPANNYQVVDAPPAPPGAPKIDTSNPKVSNNNSSRINDKNDREEEPKIRVNPWDGLQYGHDFSDAPPVNPDRPLDAITDKTHDVLKANIGDPNDLKASPSR